MTGMSDKIRNGALWTYIQTAGVAAIRFVAGVILARILSPEDFGVFIAVSAFSSILLVQIRFGIPQAIVFLDKVNRSQLNSAFWLMEIIALFAVLITLASMGWLESWYEDDRFTGIFVITFLNFFLTPYIFIKTSLLRREMDFKKISQLTLIGQFVSMPVSILLALSGFGPYSLAITGVISSLISVALMYSSCSWQPGGISIYNIKSLLPYSWRVNLNATQQVMIERVDNILVGALLGIASLGIYNRAYSLSRLPVEQFVANIYPLLFSGLSRVKGDLEKSRAIFYKSICVTTLVSYPLLVILMSIGEDFIFVVYGEQWISASEPLFFLLLGSFATVLSIQVRSLNAAQNLVGREVYINAFTLVFTLFVVWYFSQGGLLAIAIAISVREYLFLLVLCSSLMRSSFGFDFVCMIKALMPATLGICISYSGINLFDGGYSVIEWVRIIEKSVLYGVLYILSLLLIYLMLRRFNHILDECLGYVILKVKP